jgi:copper transport protein
LTPPGRRHERRVAYEPRAIAVAAMCAICVMPITATAHAVLVASDPAAGARIDSAPQTVRLTFDEPVETSVGSLRVFDAKGESHTSGPVFHPGGDARSIAAHIDAMQRGQFVVSWQVVSADSHIVDGTYAFGFGVPAGEAPPIHRDPASKDSLPMVRFLMLAGVLLGAGLAIAGAMLGARASASFDPIEIWAWIMLASFALADVLLRADIIGGSPAAIFATRVGMLRAVTIVASLAAIVTIAGKRRQIPLLTAAIAAALSLTLAGHAAVGDWAVIGVGADLLHLLAAAAWIGVLAAALSIGSDADVRLIIPVAGFAVVAIVITGIVQTVRNVGSFSPLLSSAYGLAIDLKIGLLALTLLAALGARQALKRDRRAFHNPIRFELLLLTGVTAVTAVLVETPLPREAATRPTVTASFAISQVTVHVSATPSDPLHWTLYIDGTDARGDPRALDGADVTLRDAERKSGPLVVPLKRRSSGAFAGDATLPWRGTWSALVSARVGEFDENHRTLSLKEN